MKKVLALVLALAMVLSSLAFTAYADDTETTVTTTVSVEVTVSGEYQGTNHWANATYSFDVTDGVAADHGWLSNGEYKFIYYPATGQIKNTSQATSFALEDNKGIPEYIVIPYTIDAFATDYATYEAKTIALYAQNANFAIFRYNTSANTNIVIPEGVTAIPGNVFGQNDSGSRNVKFIFPSTLTTIYGNAFAQSSGGGVYTNFEFPAGLTRIDGGAFSNCRNTDYVFPAGITTLNAIFTFNRALQNVTFKGAIPNIPDNCFRQCYALTSLTFEGNTTAPTVGDYAFNGVTSLADFTVYYPANATGFTDETFQAKFPTGTKFERLPGEPVAENLTITGKTILGESLTAEYDFVDPMGREESGSTATWTSCENADFTSSEVFNLGTVPCDGNTPIVYEIQETDDGKFIRCTVTPRNADTTLNVGTPKSATTATSVRFPKTIPTVTLTAPSNGYYASVNSAITLSAEATCDITTITKMEFYVNDVKVGEDDTAPYEISWTPAEMGTAAIYAKAYNALDESAVSASASVNVLAEGADTSSYITTTFTAPLADSMHLSNAPVTFTGTAVESSGSDISSVEIFANGKSIGTASSGEFSITANLAAGTYSIIAVVKSADGKSGTSQAFDITVSGMGFTTMMANDMVLQRNKPIKLSGIGVDGTVVTAELLGSTASATIAGGKWTVTLPSKPATKSTELKFTASDGTSKTFTNVAVGEVIMFSGQSNMTGGMGNAYAEWRDKDYDDIRMFFPPNLYAESSTPLNDISGGVWKIGTRDNAKEFSKVGWLTAHTLYNNTDGEVPLGLIWAATSGTSIQTWVPNGTYNNDPDLKNISQNGVRYNALVSPWLGFTIGHVVWYQGESNSFHWQNYEKDLTAYIDSYREAFNDDSMKFVIIQLPTYDAPAGYKDPMRSFTLVREGQFNVSEHLDGVATVVSIDTGYSNTIHPGDKLALSERAAAVIQHYAWNDDDIVWQSPTFDKMEVKDGKAVLTFKYIADGLKTKDGADPKGFKLMDNDGVFNDVAAKLVGNTVEIDVSAITGDVKIRYAYEDVPAQVDTVSGVNLVNSAGFPMAPFRTDNDRTHFQSYDSATGIYSGEYNFAPMVRYITASDLEQGISTITINARDYDDSIQSVEVFVDNVSVGNAVQAAEDIWTYAWDAATTGEHQIHAIATDELGTTNVAGHSSLGSKTVAPVKYGVNLKVAVPELFGKFTNLTGGEIANFDGADGVKITTIGEGKLILAAYNGNQLVKCVVTDEKSASIVAADLAGATVIKAFLFENLENIKPVANPVSINK